MTLFSPTTGPWPTREVVKVEPGAEVLLRVINALVDVQLPF